MHYSECWIGQSVEVLNERSIKATDFYSGKIILIRGPKLNQHIDLIQCDGGVKVSTIKENLVSYKKLVNSSGVKERMKLFLDAVRNMDFYFYVDKHLVDLLIYGYDY